MLDQLRVQRSAALLCLQWALLAAPAAAEPESAVAGPATAPATAGNAAEDGAAKSAARTSDGVRRWYGGQVLLADAAGIGVGAALALGLAAEREHRPSDLGLVGSAWYGVGAVAAPAVHFAHGRGEAGMASLAARALLPPLAGVLGLTAGCLVNGNFEASCRRSGVTGGSLVGLAAAAAFDASTLAYTAGSRPEPAPERSWYGWQLLALDGALLVGGAAVAAGGPRNDDGERLQPQLMLWAPGYLFGLFGGPIVHAVHGEWKHSLASFGLRSFVGPLGAVAGLMGHCAAAAGVSGCSNTGATYGLLGGMLFVDLFDAFVLGYEDVEPAEAATPPPSVTIAPGFIAISGWLP